MNKQQLVRKVIYAFEETFGHSYQDQAEAFIDHLFPPPVTDEDIDEIREALVEKEGL